jgi:hypothetical protein
MRLPHLICWNGECVASGLNYQHKVARPEACIGYAVAIYYLSQAFCMMPQRYYCRWFRWCRSLVRMSAISEGSVGYFTFPL